MFTEEAKDILYEEFKHRMLKELEQRKELEFERYNLSKIALKMKVSRGTIYRKFEQGRVVKLCNAISMSRKEIQQLHLSGYIIYSKSGNRTWFYFLKG